MASDLNRLVYYSRNRIPGTPAEVVAGVDAILASAQRNNRQFGVTGALIFNAGIFAQVLEGSRREIELTFERIQRDARHSDVEVLAFEEVQNLQFPSWSMAFVGHSREGENFFGYISEATGFEAKRMEGERIFEIMCAIAIEEEARAA
jgi:Sensors of blue-light using FAD